MFPDLRIARYAFRKNKLLVEMSITFCLWPISIDNLFARCKVDLYKSMKEMLSAPTKNGFSKCLVFSKK